MGSDAVFEAMLHQEEYPHVRWEKNEHVLQEDSRKFLISAGCGIHHLVVKDCRKSDEGIYSCFAGSTQTSARLFVEKVEITKKLHGSRRVVQSKDFEMTTETSKSSVTGRWMHNGTEVKSSQRTTITQRGAQHSLKVSGAKLSDAGEYTFKVGSKQTTAEVVVEEVKVTRVFTEMKVHSGDYTAVAGSKFTTCHLNVTSSHIDILKSMDDVEVLENEKTVLEFMISEADILAQWSHNGETVDFGKDERVKYEVDGTKHRLVISKTNFKDSGEYTFNVGGTEMKSFVLCANTGRAEFFSRDARLHRGMRTGSPLQCQSQRKARPRYKVVFQRQRNC